MNYINIYANFLKKFLKPTRPLKVIFDCSNGTTGLILKKIFKTGQLINCKLINSIPDGNFPAHGPNPMKRFALDDLRLAVKKHKADLGVIFDADGDRVLFIDNKTRLIDPDAITYLLIWHLKAKKIVIDIRIGWLVKKMKNEILKYKVIESKAGTYFIKTNTKKNHAVLGVEQTGHYYLKNFFYDDSGILTAIEVINAASKLPYSLADFVDLLPIYYRSDEINFKYPTENAMYRVLLKKIEKKYKKQATKISHLDGLTMEFGTRKAQTSSLAHLTRKRPHELYNNWLASRSLGEGWWFNLRPSNTEPLIRLNIESTAEKILARKIKELRRMLTA